MFIPNEVLLAGGLAIVAAVAVDRLNWWRRPPTGNSPSDRKGGFTLTVDIEKG